MKKIVLIFIICIAYSGLIKSQVLGVNRTIQEQDQWCWSGVSACILNYYCQTTSQCSIAEYTRTVATWHNFGTTDCCVNPNMGCNYWNYNWGYDGSIQDILVHFANISNTGISASLTESEITSDIQNNRVFVIRWGWTTGGGHFLVGHGIIDDNLYYMDPWFGEGLKIADYAWVCQSDDHTWTHTNRLTVTPPDYLPAAAGTINGPSNVCQGQDSVVYTVPEITGADSYAWTLPDGALGSSNTNSITVSYGVNALPGKLSVKGINSCGNGAPSNLLVIVNRLPANAGAIAGLSELCPGEDSVIYSVPQIANALDYLWTLPEGATGSSSGRSITVSFGLSSVSGDITVKGHNSCGAGEASVLPVTVKMLPASAESISGEAAVCQEQSSVTYVTPLIANTNTYKWTLPDGASGNSETNSILVDFGSSANSGTVSVNGINDCGDGGVAIFPVTVNPKPPTPLITKQGSLLHSDAQSGNQWYNQDGLINGAVNQDYTALSDGDYYVVVTLSGCSSDNSAVISVKGTGIEAVEDNTILKVYPNPATSEVIILLNGNTKTLGFEIINSAGISVYRSDMTNRASVKTSRFAADMYVLKFDNGLHSTFVIK